MSVDLGPVTVAGLADKYAVLRPHLDERQWRLYLGSEARAIAAAAGCSLAAAAALVAAAARVSRATVSAGAGELAAGAEVMPGRARRPGAGHPAAEDTQPGLRAALRELAEASTRGDPMLADVIWCSSSLRELAGRLADRGFACGKDAVARMLRAEGFSLQAMSKVLEGSGHEDRDAQFGHINAMIAEFRAAGDPVISVDAKKKELVGEFARPGGTWQPAGDPRKVRDHDFPDPELGMIVPYGIYDIAANRGFVSVGTSHDTAAFAVNAIRLWWQHEGAARYPGRTRLLVTCDGGGSNGHRCRLWKHELALLAAQAGPAITVCHFPPGTSKWNKIEHRLFCHITRTWRTRPLMTVDDAVAGIAATVTAQGLKCTAVRDDSGYPTGTEISDQRMRWLNTHVITRDGSVSQDWNYTIGPAGDGTGCDSAAPQPGPHLVHALAALAGISDLPALTAAIELPWQTAREQRLHLARGGDRAVRPGAGGKPAVPLHAALAATACHHHAGVSYQLLGQLLAADASTIALTASRLTPLLEPHGITPRYQRARIRTLAQLRDHAATDGITIPATTDTPETAN
jgi:hypothetical protein